MAKKIESYIKLQIPAQEANPSPPVGPALGQHGVNTSSTNKTDLYDIAEISPYFNP